MNMFDTKLDVKVADAPYQVIVGDQLLERAVDYIAPLLARPRVVIITDHTVQKLHLPRLCQGLDDGAIAYDIISLPEGEQTKSFAQLEALTDQLLSLRVERTDMLIALGGGVIGDLVGFAAAVLQRGMRYVQVPTSLLAQVDSSVGGKTAINVARGKNLVGAFHQPALVLADLGAIDTLPVRDRRAGYAEVIKYGVLGDKAFFHWLRGYADEILSGADRSALKEAITRSIQAKADIVAEDTKERGRRALLNLGHTFGHALEAAHGYDGRLLHGEAVAIGMVLALDLSHRLGMAPAADKEQLQSHLNQQGFKTEIRDLDIQISAEYMTELMQQDKKVTGGDVAFILGPIGHAEIVRGVDQEALKDTLIHSGATAETGVTTEDQKMKSANMKDQG